MMSTKSFILKRLVVVLWLFLFLLALAQGALAVGSGGVELSMLGVAVTENFDSLATAGTTNSTLPDGWYVTETGGGARDNELYGADNGGSTTGDTYSFGTAASTDRALGGLQTGTLVPVIGALFTNTTGATISSIVVSYRGEQWRLGTSGRVDRLDFQLSTNATSLSSGTWVDYNTLDFTAPISSGTVGSLLGNAVTATVSLSDTISGLSIADGASFWIRWTDLNASGADDGMAIDNFSLTPYGVVDIAPTVSSVSPTNNATNMAINSNIVITFSEAVTTTGSWYTIQGSSSGAHTAVASGGATVFTLNPDADFANSETVTVTVVAAQITDQDGTANPMAANYQFTFTTIGLVDTTPPQMSGSSPTSGAITVMTSTNVVITFTENVTLTSSAIGLNCGGAVAFSGLPQTNVSSVTLDPTAALPNSTTCTTTLTATQISDGGGNLFDGDNNGTGGDNRSFNFTTASSPVSDLFFSEYIEGSSNNKALEIYNPTGATIDLAAGVYRLELYANGAAITSPTNGINLSGMVASGDVYVVAHSSANASMLAVADFTTTLVVTFNGDDTVVLKKNGVIIDAFGQVGFDPGTAWTGSGVSTLDQTLQRKNSVTMGDSNYSDAFNPSVEWDTYAIDTFTGLGCHPARPCPVPPQLSSSRPSNGATNVATTTSSIVITFTENITLTASAVGLSCAGNIALTGLPVTNASSVTLTLGSTLPNGTSCTVALTATQITDSDANILIGTNSFSFTTVPIPGSVVLIHDIQGNGLTSPMSGTTNVSIEGIVVGDFQGSAYLNGFYVQEEDADTDADPATSEGILVYDAAFGVDVVLGDKVRVAGNVVEYTSTSNGVTSQLTELSNVSAVTIMSSGNPLPAPTIMTMPVASLDDLERFEGMRVMVATMLYVADNYTLGRYGQLTLASEVLQQFTHANAPSASGYTAHLAAIANKSLILDDGRTSQNPDPIIHSRGGTGLSASNTLRQGDTVTNLSGILDQRFEGYRIQTTTGVNFSPTNARSATPPAVGGTLRVASANVLNYFNTFTNCSLGVGGATSTSNCRGASDATEFTRQRDKTISVLQGLNGDIVGLMEMENDGYGGSSALQDLVNGLNTAMGAGTYSFIDADTLLGATNAIGTDAIKVALIYKPAVVTPVTGTTATSTDAVFDRRPLAQTFMTANGEKVTVIVNHLKSKGSCPGSGSDTDQLDGQGCWNPKRVQQATALLTFINTLTANDPDVLLLGDFNAYAKEDPITVIKNGGFTDLINAYHGTSGYSYVFDGLIGYLDHALASTSLVPQVTGAEDWHVNADEPIILDYNMEFKSTGQITSLYAADSFRASDHDPVLIGLTLTTTFNLVVAPLSGSTTESGGQATFTVKLSSIPAATVTVAITSTNLTEGVVTPTLLTFNTATWNVPQTVTVTGIDDAVADGAVAYTVNVGPTTSSDVNYNGLGPVAVALTNGDNEAVNQSPIGRVDSYSLNQNTVLMVAAPGVLSNDNDPENTPITTILAANPSHGTLTLSSNGAFVYTPTQGYVGSDFFIYMANDGNSNSSATTVALTVLAVVTPTVTVTTTATVTATATVTTTATVTATSTPTVTATSTPTVTATSTPTVTTTSTPTVTVTSTPTVTATSTPTVTVTSTPTVTTTSTPTVTATPTSGGTTTPTPTSTPVPQPNLAVSSQGAPIPQPALQAINFGSTYLNQPISRTLTLSNAGQANLVVSGITLPTGFTLLQPTVMSLTLTPAQVQPLIIQLTAKQTGTFTGVVTLVSNDPNTPFTFPLMGEVKAPKRLTCLITIIITPVQLKPGLPVIFTIRVTNTCGEKLNNLVIRFTIPHLIFRYDLSRDTLGWHKVGARERQNNEVYEYTLPELDLSGSQDLAFPVTVDPQATFDSPTEVGVQVSVPGLASGEPGETDNQVSLIISRPKTFLPIIMR